MGGAAATLERAARAGLGARRPGRGESAEGVFAGPGIVRKEAVICAPCAARAQRRLSTTRGRLARKRRTTTKGALWATALLSAPSRRCRRSRSRCENENPATALMTHVEELAALVAGLCVRGAGVVQGEPEVASIAAGERGSCCAGSGALSCRRRSQRRRSSDQRVHVRGICKPPSFKNDPSRSKERPRKTTRLLVAAFGAQFHPGLQWIEDKEQPIMLKEVVDQFGDGSEEQSSELSEKTPNSTRRCSP